MGFGKVSGFNLGSLVLATGGALLILVVYRKIKK
ncbi:MAG: GlsB/YeaQ/YmgE family stress response membrane protein [Desulfobacterales bacterium]